MILDRFIEKPKNKILYLITLIGLTLVIIIEIFIFIPIEGKISTYGILDYEFAWTVSRAESILSVWGSNGINNQVVAIYWDFLFIIGYVSLAFGLIVIAYRKSANKIQKMGSVMTLTPFLTGIFDVVENIYLLLMTNSPTSIPDSHPLIASLCATLKFGFLFIGIIYFIIAIISITINKIKK
jgi:hypothetical protein